MLFCMSMSGKQGGNYLKSDGEKEGRKDGIKEAMQEGRKTGSKKGREEGRMFTHEALCYPTLAM